MFTSRCQIIVRNEYLGNLRRSRRHLVVKAGEGLGLLTWTLQEIKGCTP